MGYTQINWFSKNAFDIVLILRIMKTKFFSNKIIVGIAKTIF